MDGHQLHAAIAAGCGIGQRRQIFEGGVEGRAEQILLAARQLVEELPEQIEIGARRIVRTTITAKGCATAAG